MGANCQRSIFKLDFIHLSLTIYINHESCFINASSRGCTPHFPMSIFGQIILGKSSEGILEISGGFGTSRGLEAILGMISGASGSRFSAFSGADMALSLETVGFKKLASAIGSLLSPLNTTSPTSTTASLLKYTSRSTIMDRHFGK